MSPSSERPNADQPRPMSWLAPSGSNVRPNPSDDEGEDGAHQTGQASDDPDHYRAGSHPSSGYASLRCLDFLRCHNSVHFLHFP